jgi:hypothetical protein
MVSSESSLARARNWYKKFERPISSISLVGGFIFDAVTLTRIDRFWDNLWVAGHLVIVATCIFLVNVRGGEAAVAEDPEKAEFWLVNVMQFFFGGLLSTYLVFYFRSGTIAASWPFLLILAVAFVANESMKRHYARLIFQTGLLFLSIYAFAIFILPVIMNRIGADVFILAGIVSLALIWLFIALIAAFARERVAKNRTPRIILVLGIFIAVNLMYFYNLIPPIPLSLKAGDVYHTLTVNAPGKYTVTHEDQGWFGFLKLADDIHIVPGDSLYAYSAIFSPTDFNVQIMHVWQWYNPNAKSWQTMSRVTLPVIGGSDGGWRTFSIIDSPAAGAWRVNVETTQGAAIGTLHFTVINAREEPSLQTTDIN